MLNLIENLKDLRTKQNLSRKDFALILGIMPGTYRKYEDGTRQPDIELLIKIADYYKVSLDYLCGRYKNQ